MNPADTLGINIANPGATDMACNEADKTLKVNYADLALEKCYVEEAVAPASADATRKECSVEVAVAPTSAGAIREEFSVEEAVTPVSADATREEFSVKEKSSSQNHLRNQIHFEYCNIRSLGNKLNLVSDYLQSCKNLDLLFLTESWLHHGHSDSMFCPKGYYSLRCDRKRGKGGGVVALCNANLDIVELNVNVSSDACYEIVAFDLFLTNSSTIRFICVYLPPAQSEAAVINLCDTLNSLMLANKPVILLGDFNFPKIDWSIPACLGNSSHCAFFQFCESHCLTQHIRDPTHLKDNTLDLLLCNNSANNLLLNHSISSPPWFSDHYLISANISHINHNNYKSDSETYSYPDFKSADYNFISNHLSQTNWDFCFDHTSNIQVIYDKFISTLHSVIVKYVPLKKNGNIKRSKPKHIKHLLRQKKIIYKKLKADKSYKASYKKSFKTIRL